MLERLSKWGERVRETWRPNWLALALSGIIWVKVALAALLVRDWRRLVDVVGHISLNFKLAKRFPSALWLMERCERVCHRKLPEDRALLQVYIGEVASLLATAGRLEEAVCRAKEAAELARDFAPQDHCRRLYQLAEILRQKGKQEEGRAAALEAKTLAENPERPVAHPVHRVQAFILWATILREESRPEEVGAWLYWAKQIAAEHKLQRQLERIATFWRD